MTDKIGPMELIVLGFEGNNFTGAITPALLDLVDRGIVRIVDLAIVIKKADGETMILEMQDLTAEVAEAMVRGLQRGQAEILVGWQSHAALWAQRLAPWLVEPMIQLLAPARAGQPQRRPVRST